ncbi:MAG: DUF389 domain-containing protein [Proteobacteria bacterium]|nr:DUF389 domain-containing protein [Pseudomonadota bacterium]
MSLVLRRLFNLRRDQDDPDVIDADIRAGSIPVGANLWVLFFAILIASVGLNVNSTAVIIGAMLISPLMGPIMAIGYGAAVQDLKLIREAAQALGLFTAISLATSALYFWLSPLDQPGSELLARTTPTMWDVLIAAFGGGAGMVAATRKDVSNVLPGVAIATALMPPLCTAGFGLAHGRWDMFGGAAYLFLINGVFIAVSTLVITKILRLPLRGNLEPATRLRHRVVITVGILAVLVPSVWMGYRFVQVEVFNRGAARVAQQLQAQPEFNIVAYKMDEPTRTLSLTLLGRYDEARLKEMSDLLMSHEGLKDCKLVVRRAGDEPVDVGALRNQIKQDMDRTLVDQLRVADGRLKEVEGRVEQLLAAPEPATTQVDVASLGQEVRAQLPQVQALTLAYGQQVSAVEPPAAGASAPRKDAAVVVVERTRPLSAAQRSTLQRWLQVRLNQPEVQLLEQAAAVASGRR